MVCSITYSVSSFNIPSYEAKTKPKKKPRTLWINEWISVIFIQWYDRNLQFILVEANSRFEIDENPWDILYKNSSFFNLNKWKNYHIIPFASWFQAIFAMLWLQSPHYLVWWPEFLYTFVVTVSKGTFTVWIILWYAWYAVECVLRIQKWRNEINTFLRVGWDTFFY